MILCGLALLILHRQWFLLVFLWFNVVHDFLRGIAICSEAWRGESSSWLLNVASLEAVEEKKIKKKQL